MAHLFPNIELINNLRPAPTEGELHCLKVLQKKLSNDFEIYFQPFINGDHPDIVIMRKNAGVYIIEIKDWHFDSYKIDKEGWRLKSNNALLRSPLDQVSNYKENLYNLHVDGLLEKKIYNKKLYSLIKVSVYFHFESKESIDSCIRQFAKKSDSHIDLYGNDSLEDINNSILEDYGSSSFFTEDLYNEFQRFLQPSFHIVEQGLRISYSQKQTELSSSEQNKQQKVRGVAGSGKTLVLAKRAVNAYKRTKKKVLILTFNITLKNYIHDKISEVREDFSWKNFYIDSYHNFINSQTNNLNIKVSSLDDYQNLDLFKAVEVGIVKYDSIFIDEIQDYKSEWIRIIKRYFLVLGGEFVVFGDEKQNIYTRIMDSDNKPNTTIPGRWTELNESYRLSDKIAKLSSRFQREFFSNKYEFDEIAIVEQGSLFSYEGIEYHNLNEDISAQELFNIIWQILLDKNIHSNDVCILSATIKILRELDFYIRKKENTKTTFEIQEVYEKLLPESSDLDQELENVRKNKKFNFWMNPGVPKLSTIHSFKGWEAPTVFLIIESNEHNDELLYTAITRCRYNLFVINIGNKRYEDFFVKNNDLVDIFPMNL